MANPASYLATLRRIPDDIILAIAAQDFEENRARQCVCGWAFRESLARELNRDADTPLSTTEAWLAIDSEVRCHERFGGRARQWSRLFIGASEDTPNVEAAFVDRLDEIVRVPAPRRRSRSRTGGDKT